MPLRWDILVPNWPLGMEHSGLQTGRFLHKIGKFYQWLLGELPTSTDDFWCTTSIREKVRTSGSQRSPSSEVVIMGGCGVISLVLALTRQLRTCSACRGSQEPDLNFQTSVPGLNPLRDFRFKNGNRLSLLQPLESRKSCVDAPGSDSREGTCEFLELSADEVLTIWGSEAHKGIKNPPSFYQNQPFHISLKSNTIPIARVGNSLLGIVNDNREITHGNDSEQ